MFWTSSIGLIELQITKQDATSGYHQGDCADDVTELSKPPRIRRQLAKIDAETLRRELDEYGCWDEQELSSHEDNLLRLLWIACGEIAEEIR